jgi:Amt family ammonium transporter
MLTSLADEIKPQELSGAGVLKCLSKPVSQSALFDVLMETVNRVPQPPPPVAAPDVAVAPAPAVPAASPHWKILVAEDNDVNQIVIQAILQKAGHACDLAANGRIAVESAQRQAYDLVLMDCQMPEVDGFEATRQIRELSNQGAVPLRGRSRLPILALTANAMSGDRERCLGAGMDGYIAKPINVAELLATIQNLMAQFRPQNATATGSAPAPAGGAPVASGAMTALTERCLGDPAIADLILQKFQEQLSQTMAALDQANLGHDLEVVSHLAQRLEGAATNRVAAISEVIAELERHARICQPVQETLDRLRAQVEQCLKDAPLRAGLTSPRADLQLPLGS